MPPPGSRQPDGAAADSLVAWLEDSLDRAAAAGPSHLTDQVVLHRLNRKEYTNAVRDLLAVDFDASDVLLTDDVAEGYDNIAAALQVSPSFIEQYAIPARPVALRARGKQRTRGPAAGHSGGRRHAADARARIAARLRGGILARVDLPADGEHRVSIADIVTNIWGSGMGPRTRSSSRSTTVRYETSIGGEEDMKLYDQVQNGALDRVNARLKNIKFAATAGPHRIGVTFSCGRTRN